ncbi:MAG: efflux RND transporter periplasmic adaptor subunit [Longimicrobiales bacterium]
MVIKRRPVLIGLVVILGLAAAGAGIYWRIQAQAAASENEAGAPSTEGIDVASASAFAADVPIPVEGAAVVRDTLIIAVSASAEAAAARTTKIVAQVGGQIQAVPVAEGQAVGAGRLLVRIDPARYELAVEDAEAGLERARATYREQTLFDDRIEDANVRAERERIARAKSGLETAEVALRRARLDLAQTTLRSPFPGRVASLLVVPGEWLQPGDELLTIVDIDPIKVEVQVLESEIGFITAGSRAQVTFAAFPETPFGGRIATINPVVAGDTRTAKVTVLVPNPGGRILPGMFARVSLDARKFADRILVPREAILERDRRTMLFVHEDGRAKWRYVTTGLQSERLVEIVENPETEMVEPGEVVLVGGHHTLIHDARVTVVADATAEGGRPR